VKTIWCSTNTVDCYNPKVIQATMGSLTRVTLTYLDLSLALKESDRVVYGAFMGGDNVYTGELIQDGIIVLGNEANGISDAIAALITKKIAIPRFGELLATESLNVATATAIVLSEFKRRTLIEK
jgi:TrmH family RNA methyltransferase